MALGNIPSGKFALQARVSGEVSGLSGAENQLNSWPENTRHIIQC